MLDARTETFLVLSRTLNYTKAAKELFITQPAVTQHIQFLEKTYGVRLFNYASRELSLTSAGKMFLKYIQESKATDKLIESRLKEVEGESRIINFGATRTIGEFTIAPILKEFFTTFMEHKINIQIQNTEQILNNLDKGELEFALIEGLFEKSDYNTKILKEEEFILVINSNHRLRNKRKVKIEDLLSERIIVRELGSGSREILQRGLYDKNIFLDNFKDIIQIGNVGLMKKLVMDGIGISFMYEDAAIKEIEEGRLIKVEIIDFKLLREFNFVTINKPSIINHADIFYKFFKEKLK